MSAAALAGLGLGLGLRCLVSVLPRLNRPTLASRVAPYVADLSAGAREWLAPPTSGPAPVLAVLVEPLFERGRRALESVLGGGDVVARRLRQAGAVGGVERFRSEQLAWGTGGGVIGGVVGVLVVQQQSAPGVVAVASGVLGLALGVVGRDRMLVRAARRRLARLGEELPVVLEFLTLSLSAGEGILDALRRVSQVGSGELSRELAAVVAAVNTGLPFGETLSRTAADLDLPAFTRAVDQMLGALDRGTPLAEVLRAQAQDSREEAKNALLEVAGKKEVGMLVPLVFLILPVTILFAIFPGIAVLQVGL